MTKKALIGLYIIIVLSIAGFAQARVIVTETQLISDRLISVSGYYTSACDIGIVPSISNISPGIVKDIATLKLAPKEDADAFCVQIEQRRKFDLSIDLYTLDFIQNGDYDMLISGNNSIPAIGITIKDQLTKNFPKSVIHGQLLSQNDRYFLVSEGKTYELNTNSIRQSALNDYIGERVRISGYLFDEDSSSLQDPFSPKKSFNFSTLVVESISSLFD